MGKEALMKQSEELNKEREIRLAEEEKKAREANREDLCELCGQAYVGDDAKEQHLKFKVHEMFKLVREKISELKPRVEEFEAARKEAKDQDRKARRKEEWDAAMEKDRGRDRDRGGRDRDRADRGGRDSADAEDRPRGRRDEPR